MRDEVMIRVSRELRDRLIKLVKTSKDKSIGKYLVRVLNDRKI